MRDHLRYGHYRSQPRRWARRQPRQFGRQRSLPSPSGGSGRSRYEPVDPDVDLNDPAQRAGTSAIWPREWPVLLAIGIGGVLGAESRYGLDRPLPPRNGAFPWATLVINVSGCLLIGLPPSGQAGPPAIPSRTTRMSTPERSTGRPSLSQNRSWPSPAAGEDVGARQTSLTVSMSPAAETALMLGASRHSTDGVTGCPGHRADLELDSRSSGFDRYPIWTGRLGSRLVSCSDDQAANRNTWRKGNESAATPNTQS